MTPPTATPQTAVWYFLGAAFTFISPMLLFRGVDAPWLSILTLLLGFVLVGLGVVVFIREQRQRRAARDDADPR